MKIAGYWAFLFLLDHVYVSLASKEDTHKREERKSKGVTTFVSAKWETTPIVLELAEYLSGESTDLFWSFFDGIISLKTNLDAFENEKQIYDACIGVASTLLAPAQLRMAKLALSMHLTSPTVHMFDQIATQNGAKNQDCNTFVSIASRKICDDNALRDILQEYDQYDPQDHRLETYLLDHSYPSSDNQSLTAILYGELGTATFSTKHKILAGYADKGAINYVVRWNVKPRGKPKLRLSGYGVELQLKSTEYKSQDDSTPKETEGGDTPVPSEEEDENDPQNQIDGFNFGRLKNLFPALRTPLERFRRHLSETSEELEPLKVWQMQALSMQAAAAIVDAHDAGGDEALKMLTAIAQNFPMQTKSLIHVNVPRPFRDEVLHNQDIWASSLGLRPSEPLLLVSGAQYDAEEVDIMTLLTALREDIGPMNTLHALGLSKKSINTLMSLDLGESFTWEEYGLDIRDSSITWLNDLETDERYRRWPTSYMELLRPTYPGMLRNLRRNIYNYVIIVDPTSPASTPPLKLGETLLKHATPVRVGLVLAPPRAAPDAAHSAMAAAVRSAFNYVAQERNSNKEAFYFLTQLLQSSQNDGLNLELVKKYLKKYASSSANIDEIIAEDSEYNFGHQLAEEFVSKLGTDVYPQVLVNGVPLREEGAWTVETLEESLVAALARLTGRLQRAVFRGDLGDADDALEHLMRQPHVMPRLNRRVLSSEPNQYLDLMGVPSSPELFTEEKMHRLLHLTGRDALATALPILKYFKKPGKQDKITQTVWVAGDLNSKESRGLLRNALTFMRESSGVRVAFIPNVESGGNVDQSLNKVVLAALNVLEPAEATKYVARLLEDEGCHERQDCDILPSLVPALNKHEWVLKAARVLCARSLRLRSGQRAVAHNARLVGPFNDDEPFTLDDFVLLERFSSQSYGDKIAEVLTKKRTATNEVLDDDDDDAVQLSDADYLKVVSVLAARGPRTRTPLPSGLRADHSVIELQPAYPEEAAIEVVVALDPASTAAQRLGPLLLVLRRVVNCRVKLFLNPQDKNSDMPLKSFYRYVLEAEPQFSAAGARSGALARFSRLPHAPLLSLELRTPPNWLVECVKSVYDLDNIRLADVESLVHSEFELEYLLLEGHAWDATLGTPPRGLQLVLGTRENPERMDTIVMANLGYFQLKANPGAWILRLRPGRSEEIYEIVGHENTDTPAGSEDIQVLMSSFKSHVIKLRVNKKPDKQNHDLLVENEDKNSGGIWNSIASSFGGGEEQDAHDDTINIFSVASGHLYERFIRIMMLSVLKNTKSPVKFWFLKNYLSPSLKDILPYMAKDYGFEYELVQYQWPRWLQRQRDRQRTIWGYKILFLDVLFPLHVKKIIFVDADQIVRADLKELVDFDLGGAPYGYTPFCDSRKEMEGFRFWKQGYWRNHLQGRSYHISALYVVDLRRFRRIAAGDRLRGQYQALSQDPNSLSNLDQDLPNNMIHQVAIKSLPQEWLWCETWCDEPSKKYAKTIDLCNNPLTKEAKLSAAMRIVPEWSEYDAELKALQARVRRGLYQERDHDQEVDSVHQEEITIASKTEWGGEDAGAVVPNQQMRASAPNYPVDRYLVQSNEQNELVNIINDNIWYPEPALRPEDEIMLRKLHEMLQSTADDLKVLSSEISKYHEPGVHVKSAPTPLDEEFNEKVHIEEVVNAKFHGHKVIERQTTATNNSQKDYVDGYIKKLAAQRETKKQLKTTGVQVKQDPTYKEPMLRKLTLSSTKLLHIANEKSNETKVDGEPTKKIVKPSITYKEISFVPLEPKVKEQIKTHLQLQHMPSINIRSELKMQKVLQLDIIPQTCDDFDSTPVNNNVSVIAMQHEADKEQSNHRIQITNAPNLNLQKDVQTHRKVSKMSTCDSSESSHITSNIQRKIKLQKLKKNDNIHNRQNNLDKKSKRSQAYLEEWKRKLNSVYGPSTSRTIKPEGNTKKLTRKPSTNRDGPKTGLNNADYIPYSKLTLGGVRVSDIENEISNMHNKGEIPLSPILDKILSSRENSFHNENSKKNNKNKSQKILTASDEDLLQEVLDIQKKVTNTLSENITSKLDHNESPLATENNSYADDFDEEKTDISAPVDYSNHPSPKYNSDDSTDGSPHSPEKEDHRNPHVGVDPNMTYTKLTNLSIKNSVDIFEFLHSIDTQDNATQSNHSFKISLKETQTSPTNEKSTIKPIHNDLWIDPTREVEKKFQLEKDLIKKLIIEEYGDLLEKSLNKPTTSNHIGIDNDERNVLASQKNTQTSPARVKNVMTSPTRTKTRTTSPFILNTSVNQQTSPWSALKTVGQTNDAPECEDLSISINLSSPRFSLKLPKTSREVLSNINTQPIDHSQHTILPLKHMKPAPSSSSSAEADYSSDISSLGEINKKFNQLRRRHRIPSVSEISSTSSVSMKSVELSAGVIPLKSEGEVSIGQVPRRKSKVDYKRNKSDGELSLGQRH